MTDHFIKLRSFYTVRSESGVLETDPTRDYVERSWIVINLAQIIYYCPPSDPQTVLISNKNEIDINLKYITALRLKERAVWIDMTFDAFDQIFQGYLESQGVAYSDYSTKSI